MRRTKTQEGITLVALIITIIILLILATVTIMSITGDGIIGKSRQAKIDYERGKQEEEGLLGGYLSKMDEISSGESSGDNGSEGGDSNSGNNSSEEQNPNIASYTSDGVPIPVGFKYITGEKDTGVVVQNEADGSEFVWVPVNTTIVSYGLGTTSYREPDIVSDYDNNTTYLNIIKNILGTTYSNSADFLDDLQNDFKAMANSVNNNKGFYVGRYETSLSGGKAQSVKGVTSAIASTSSANRWYGLYAYQKAYSTNSVQGSMIWGSQYDAMMTWMGSAANTTISGRNQSRVTGSEEYPDDIVKNVYDLYGNSYEWTLEAGYTDSRVGRGGKFNRAYSPSERNYCYPTSTYSFYGSRLALYIK